jgi:hypothetical protein
MDFSIKKQLVGYQSWLNLADTIELTELKAINRYDYMTFLFVFIAVLLAAFIMHMLNPLISGFTLFMHIFLGINIIKAKAVVGDALLDLENYKSLNANIARFLNKEYSIFLVSQGKKPLSESAIDNLEIHTGKFVEGKMTRGGRSDSIRRFRLSFLKKEKRFFDYQFGILIILEVLAIL